MNTVYPPKVLDVHTRTIARGLAAICLLAAFPQTHAQSDDPRYRAIGELGTLNGIALQCRYIDQVRRLKSAVVAYAPKERSFGLAFDEATNDAFLRFMREKDVCPAKESFTRLVGHRIDDLKSAFSEAQ
jgi:hypothetical protein